MSRKLVIAPVTRHERNRVTCDRTEHDGTGGRPVRRVDHDLLGTIQELVKARTAKDTQRRVVISRHPVFLPRTPMLIRAGVQD